MLLRNIKNFRNPIRQKQKHKHKQAEAYRVAKNSLAKAREAILPFKWNKEGSVRFEYVSEQKLKRLYDELGEEYFDKTLVKSRPNISVGYKSLDFPPIGSISADIGFAKETTRLKAKQPISKIRKISKKLIASELLCKDPSRPERGKYLLIRFPFYAGKIRLKTYNPKDFNNTFWWQGRYLNLEIFACGNVANLLDEKIKDESPLWDPSGCASSHELFMNIVRKIDKDSFDLTQLSSKEIFATLNNLNDGTRREREGYRTGWREMLLRCDHVEETGGCCQVFGSPVWSTFENIGAGYGWYFICGDIRKRYYGEWSGSEWTNRWGIAESSFYRARLDSDNIIYPLCPFVQIKEDGIQCNEKFSLISDLPFPPPQYPKTLEGICSHWMPLPLFKETFDI